MSLHSTYALIVVHATLDTCKKNVLTNRNQVDKEYYDSYTVIMDEARSSDTNRIQYKR